LFAIEYEAYYISSVYIEFIVKNLDIFPIKFMIKVKPMFRKH